MNNLTRKILFVALIIYSLPTFSQEKQYGYYPNGERRVEVVDSNNHRKLKEYYKSGVLKDMYQLRNDTLIGKRKKYFENGKVNYSFDYSHDPIVNYVNIKRYRSDGALKSTGAYIKNKRYGVLKKYNKKGEVTYYSDMHKNRVVTVPRRYKKGKHLKGSNSLQNITHFKVQLIKEEDRVKIKSGAIVSLYLDRGRNDHIQIDGFSNDSIYVSDFAYDMSDNKKPLKYIKSFALSYEDVDTLFFSRNHVGGAEEATNMLLIASSIFMFEPPLLLLISGLPFNFGVGVLMTSSVPLYLWYRHLSKKLNPKAYKLKEWAIKPIN